MKIKIFIILLLLSNLLPATETDKLREVDQIPKPIYEKVPFINDYRINQPIKGAIRWGSVGVMSGLLLDVSNGHISSDIIYFKYTLQMMKFGFYGGALFGLYQGYIYIKDIYIKDIYIKVKRKMIQIFNYSKIDLVMK